MSNPARSRGPWLLTGALALVTACAGPSTGRPGLLRYVGSSTIGQFMRDAQQVYPEARFVLDTQPESAGGEEAILEGRADIAGVANRPDRRVLAQGVQATEIGRDAIAVIVHPSNPIRALSREQLADVFAGRVQSWSSLGGPDRPVTAYIVGSRSATRRVFRGAVLGERDYAGCEVVRPDADIVTRVEQDPGGIGQISLAFLDASRRVRPIAVDGQPPSTANADYPIARPLYLLWWPGRGRVERFVDWTTSPAGRAVLLRHFALPGPADGG